MGSGPSKPEIDLLPPKIKRDEGPLDRAHETPFDHGFGKVALQRVLYDFADTHSRVRGNFKPGNEMTVTVDANPMLPSQQATVLAKYLSVDTVLPWQFSFGAKVNGHTGVQVAALVDRSWLFHATGNLDLLYAPPPVLGTNSNLPTEEELQSEKGTGFPFISRTTGAGLRYLDPAQRFTIGANIKQALKPFEVWSLVNLSSDFSVGLRGAASMTETRPTVDFGLSYHVGDNHELSFTHETSRDEMALRFYSQNTMRRRIHNPFEEGHIKGIYNYMDVGVELRKRLSTQDPPSLMVGSAWQMNKNLALKLRAGTEGAAGTLVARSWWDPAITVGVTASLQPSQETPRLGLFLGIDQGVDVEYRKAVPTSRLQGVSHKALVSIPSTDARDSKTPDQQPFAPLPPGMSTRPVREVSFPPGLTNYGNPNASRSNHSDKIHVSTEELQRAERMPRQPTKD